MTDQQQRRPATAAEIRAIWNRIAADKAFREVCEWRLGRRTLENGG